MCVVSMIMDHKRDEWWRRLQQPTTVIWPQPKPRISDEEIEEFRRLLDRAREYDKRMNQPDCELDSKKLALKTLAKELGVEVSFL